MCVCLKDYHGTTANAKPVKDVQQNLNVTAASRNATHTSFTFYRSYNTGDFENDIIIAVSLKLNQFKKVLILAPLYWY